MVSTDISLVLSSVLAILFISALQIYKGWFASTQTTTILGGFIGSWIFILALTAISNLEALVLRSGFQAKLFPEVLFCLIAAVVVCGMVHRVCVTTCVIFSLIGLYFINNISQKVHGTLQANTEVHISMKKKKRN